jgi:hypothetical protein
MPPFAENPAVIHQASTPRSPNTSKFPIIAGSNEERETEATNYDGSDNEIECKVCFKNGRSGKGYPTAEELEKALHGWPAVAKLISKHPGLEAFPSFRELNVKSLLYYQAELDQLQEELHECEWEDHTRRNFGKAGLLNAYLDSLRLCKDSEEKGAQKQFRLIEEIRVVLEKYSKSMISTLFAITLANTLIWQMPHYYSTTRSKRFLEPIVPTYSSYLTGSKKKMSSGTMAQKAGTGLNRISTKTRSPDKSSGTLSRHSSGQTKSKTMVWISCALAQTKRSTDWQRGFPQNSSLGGRGGKIVWRKGKNNRRRGGNVYSTSGTTKRASKMKSRSQVQSERR